MLNREQREQLLRSSTIKSLVEAPQMGSTNDEALERCRTSDSLELPLLVITDRQVRGRGREGKPWYWEPGGLTFSLVLPRPSPATSQVAISLVAGVAVGRACLAVMSPSPPALQPRVKWPNDLLIQGKKVAGILVESLLAPSPVNVIGIGLNVNQTFGNAPAPIREQATSLRLATGSEYSLFDVLGSVVAHLHESLDQAHRDPEWLVDQWHRLSVHDQAPATLHVGSRTFTGRVLGIEASGALLMEIEGRVERFVSGSLRLRLSE